MKFPKHCPSEYSTDHHLTTCTNNQYNPSVFLFNKSSSYGLHTIHTCRGFLKGHCHGDLPIFNPNRTLSSHWSVSPPEPKLFLLRCWPICFKRSWQGETREKLSTFNEASSRYDIHDVMFMCCLCVVFVCNYSIHTEALVLQKVWNDVYQIPQSQPGSWGSSGKPKKRFAACNLGNQRQAAPEDCSTTIDKRFFLFGDVGCVKIWVFSGHWWQWKNP